LRVSGAKLLQGASVARRSPGIFAAKLQVTLPEIANKKAKAIAGERTQKVEVPPYEGLSFVAQRVIVEWA